MYGYNAIISNLGMGGLWQKGKRILIFTLEFFLSTLCTSELLVRNFSVILVTDLNGLFIDEVEI